MDRSWSHTKVAEPSSHVVMLSISTFLSVSHESASAVIGRQAWSPVAQRSIANCCCCCCCCCCRGRDRGRGGGRGYDPGSRVVAVAVVVVAVVVVVVIVVVIAAAAATTAAAGGKR